MDYFRRLPLVEYCNETAVNILARGKIRDLVKQNAVTFYNYKILDGQRPDFISEEYYGSPKYVWLIFYANDIFDPLHDWLLSDRDFRAYMAEKYGTGESIISNSSSLYFNATDQTLRTDNVAEADILSKVIQYRYVEINDTDNNDNDGTYFVRGVESNSTSPLAKVYLEKANTIDVTIGTKLITQSANQNGALVNLDYEQPQRVVKNFYNVQNLIIDTETYVALPSTEKSVKSIWDWEQEQNENKREIKLIDSDFLIQITTELANLFD